MQTRKSVRSFLPDTTIRDLLELASWSPSNCNTQPWIVHVASGRTIERLRAEVLVDALANGLSPEIPYNTAAYPPRVGGGKTSFCLPTLWFAKIVRQSRLHRVAT